MALNAAIIWGVKTTGNNNNGGGWNDTGGASTDYSENDAPILSVADAVANGTTTVTSVTGGFTAAMVGSIINILTKGRFEITVVTDGNTITVDRNVAAGSGLTANVGGAVADLEEIDSVIIAGNTVHVKAGTYNSVGAISTTAGLLGARVSVLGYNANRGDEPTGDNRPLIAAGAQDVITGMRNTWRHLRFTTTDVFGVQVGIGSLLENAKVTQNSGSIAVGIRLAADAAAVDCEVEGTNVWAIQANGNNCHVSKCYLHDGLEGFYCSGFDYITFLDTIIDDMTAKGLHFLGAHTGQRIEHCTINNCVDGIDCAGGPYMIVRNCQITNNSGIGIRASTATRDALLNYNNYHGNGTDITNVTKGPNATSNAPGYANEAGGDFSGVDDANGFGIRLGVG